mmetsp:Transcript_8751/g.34374  ORF Transcript_8751/g.34374 Transcript_8751/m.34374 type:complete len:489 (-) Transcript_8751:1294-2760(-)
MRATDLISDPGPQRLVLLLRVGDPLRSLIQHHRPEPQRSRLSPRRQLRRQLEKLLQHPLVHWQRRHGRHGNLAEHRDVHPRAGRLGRRGRLGREAAHEFLELGGHAKGLAVRLRLSRRRGQGSEELDGRRQRRPRGAQRLRRPLLRLRQAHEEPESGRGCRGVDRARRRRSREPGQLAEKDILRGAALRRKRQPKRLLGPLRQTRGRRLTIHGLLRRLPDVGDGGVVPKRVGELLDALHGELSLGTVFAVKELLERPARLRGVVGEEPSGDVRVALVGDGVVLVRRQPDPLEHRERAEDVAEVGGNLKDVAVLLLDTLQVAGELRNLRVGAARSLEELIPPQLHVLHALELLANLLDLVGVRKPELRAEPLGASALGQRGEQQPDGARDAGVLHGLPLTRGNETHGVQVTGHSLEVLADEVRDEAQDGGAQVLAHGRDQAPVQDAELTVVGAEEVTRVGIRVERPDVEQHRQVTRERHRAQPGHVALL